MYLNSLCTGSSYTKSFVYFTQTDMKLYYMLYLKENNILLNLQSNCIHNVHMNIFIHNRNMVYLLFPGV